jgi:hypothetical protein
MPELGVHLDLLGLLDAHTPTTNGATPDGHLAAIADIPSKEEIIEQAQSAEEIVGEQPSPEELLRGRRRD